MQSEEVRGAGHRNSDFYSISNAQIVVAAIDYRFHIHTVRNLPGMVDTVRPPHQPHVLDLPARVLARENVEVGAFRVPRMGHRLPRKGKFAVGFTQTVQCALHDLGYARDDGLVGCKHVELDQQVPIERVHVTHLAALHGALRDRVQNKRELCRMHLSSDSRRKRTKMVRLMFKNAGCKR